MYGGGGLANSDVVLINFFYKFVFKNVFDNSFEFVVISNWLV